MYLSTMCMENSDKPTVCLDLLSIKYQLRSLQLLLPIPGPLLQMADVLFLFSYDLYQNIAYLTVF